LAPVLLQSVGKEVNAALLRAVVKEIEQYGITSTDRVTRVLLDSVGLGTSATLHFHAIVYSERSTPVWHAGSAYANLTHELIVVASRDRYVMICASDGMARNKIVKRLKTARPMSPDALTKFVGAEAAAIWLDGLHTPTSSRPDTKFMTGPALEYALDPLGDQTFRYSAIRSHPDVAGLKDAKGRSRAIGASPESARLWVGRPDAWTDFAKQLAAILDHALSKAAGADLYGFLAKPTTNTQLVKNAYAVAILPPELLSEESISDADREEARRWAYDTRLTVYGGAGPSLEIEAFLEGRRLGRVALEVTEVGQEIAIGAKWTNRPAGLEAERQRCACLLTDTDQVKIYYDSGHTLAKGRFYESGFTDQPFDWRFEPMKGFDVDREKPLIGRALDIGGIGKRRDKSLFGLVVRQLFPSGWLACDDGSMELADFVHIDEATRALTLVHAKGSGSTSPTREVSVSDYEVVVSQAIKNLRHLHRHNVFEELSKGKGKKIGAAVWKNGVRQPDRSGFLAAAQTLRASTKKAVMILQPRLTSAEHQACMGFNADPSRSMRMKQLNTLMLAARLSAMACGADLIAVGEQ
jgi:hypothetical protein